MEKDDKGSTMIRMGVSGWIFLLVPAYPGCPGSKAVKRSSSSHLWIGWPLGSPEQHRLRHILCISFRDQSLNTEYGLGTDGNALSPNVTARWLCLWTSANAVMHVHCDHSVNVNASDQGQHGCGQLNQTTSLHWILVCSLSSRPLFVEAIHEDSHATHAQGKHMTVTTYQTSI